MLLYKIYYKNSIKKYQYATDRIKPIRQKKFQGSFLNSFYSIKKWNNLGKHFLKVLLDLYPKDCLTAYKHYKFQTLDVF